MSNFARLRALALCIVLATVAALPANAALPVAASGDGPRVVFQINDAATVPTVLRFVTNYLIAEPSAQIAVVGYGPGIDFMLVDAKDPGGKAYEAQLTALAERGVAFKVCNNTLKSRSLTPAVVSAQATVVPSAVNEIIRLQTREGYAYFQHQK